MDTCDVALRRKGKPGSRGYQYEALFAGEVIASSKDPEYAACRALLAKGLTGRVRFWSDVYGPQKDWRSSLDIERGARGTTQELNKGGVRVVKYTEFSWPDEGEAEAAELEIAA